jgi:microcin C transport system permease protein
MTCARIVSPTVAASTAATVMATVAPTVAATVTASVAPTVAPTIIATSTATVAAAAAPTVTAGGKRRALSPIMRISPITRRRIAIFRHNRRGFISFWIFLVLFAVTLPAEFVANDRPLLIHFDNHWYFPALFGYSEDTFGSGFMPTEADYTDPEVVEAINGNGWMIWPPVPFSYDTIVKNLSAPAPAPPSWRNPLGTDDQARDVLARVIYGFRLSVLFGFTLTAITSVIGVCAGAVQGYYGGLVDLLFQRFIEIWNGMPELYLLIILGSIITPGFWILLIFLLLFRWMSLTGVVRAEFLRGRNLEYVRAAKALGVSDIVVMWRHILPNAMVATLTYLPFILSGSVTLLSTLDFLGFGLPPGTPSLGELVAQARNNLQAPWLGITAFAVLAGMLILLIFIGEAVRDAFDPRRTPR